MIPRHKSSEFFAFFGIFEKFGAVLGPALFGVVAAASGSSRPAILAVILFFVVGGYSSRASSRGRPVRRRDAESAVGLGAPG